MGAGLREIFDKSDHDGIKELVKNAREAAEEERKRRKIRYL